MTKRLNTKALPPFLPLNITSNPLADHHHLRSRRTCEITYAEVMHELSNIANIFETRAVRRSDTVSIYLPMIWDAVAIFLACARIGGIHSVVFSKFSPESLRGRVRYQ